MRIEVNYIRKLTPEGCFVTDDVLDVKITKALEAVGLKWYGQGTDLITGRRNICFDYDAKEETK